ncbi:unnamed protein product [Scytosiphon promiscuus]
MLSLRLLKVSGVLLPERLPSGNNINTSSSSSSSSSEVGLSETKAISSWTVQLRHGSQQHRARFAPLESSHQALPPNQPRRTDLMAAFGSPGKEEVEFEDKGGEEKVEIALLFDMAPDTMPGRQLFRHSVTSIDPSAFRAQPEMREELWLPLQPVNHNDDDTRDYGAIQVSVMYTDDYVAQGYMFGLFCGLTPMRMDNLPWSGRAT